MLLTVNCSSHDDQPRRAAACPMHAMNSGVDRQLRRPTRRGLHPLLCAATAALALVLAASAPAASPAEEVTALVTVQPVEGEPLKITPTSGRNCPESASGPWSMVARRQHSRASPSRNCCNVPVHHSARPCVVATCEHIWSLARPTVTRSFSRSPNSIRRFRIARSWLPIVATANL